MASDDSDDQAPSAPEDFSTTSWSLISAARGDSFAALEELARRYYGPIRAFIAARGHAAKADDLTQEFFARKFLKDSFLRSADREAGRFRTFVKACLRHFLIDRFARDRARPAPGDAPGDVRLDASPAAEADPSPQLTAQDLAADLAMQQAWARQVIAHARQRLAEECARASKSALHAEFVRELDEDPAAGPHRKVAARLGLSESGVRTAFHRLRERLKFLIREEIKQTVRTAQDCEAELSDLFRSLAVPDPPKLA